MLVMMLSFASTETIQVRDNQLTLSRRFCGIWIPFRYRCAAIDNIYCTCLQVYNQYTKTISFDYVDDKNSMSTIHFARGLSAQEAQYLVSLLKKHLSSKSREDDLIKTVY
jgi:hypothetical protein